MRSSLVPAISAILLSATALVAAAEPSAPAPAPAKPPAPLSCKLTGDVLIAEVSRATVAPPKTGPGVATFATRVFATGGWERTDTAADGKATKVSGCLSPGDLQKLHTDLDGLLWTQTPNKMTCDALSATVTDVVYRGKVVFAEEMCPSKVLDAKSAAGLADAEALVETARKSGKR